MHDVAQAIQMKNIITRLYEGDTFYIYQLDKIPQGPWLDNGSIMREMHYVDKNLENDELLESEEGIMYDDGGTEEYNFTNGKRLVVPHDGSIGNESEYKLQYGDIELKDLRIENIGIEIVKTILDKLNN